MKSFEHIEILIVGRKKIQEINWQRKNEQKQAGGTLKQLEERLVVFFFFFFFDSQTYSEYLNVYCYTFFSD